VSADTGGLDKTLLAGVMWTGAFRWGAQILSWAATIIVVRLLQPTDFGAFGMVNAVAQIGILLAEFGLASTIVAHRELSETQVEQLHTASYFVAFFGGLLAAGLAKPLALFYREPKVFGAMLVMAAMLLFAAAAAVPLGILGRRLQYRTLAMVDMGRSVAASASVLTLAFLGLGFWALVFGQVLGALAALIIAARAAGIGFRRVVWSDIRSVMRYGWQVTFGRVAWLAYSGAHLIVGGRVLGAGALGSYTLAWTLAGLPGEKITNVVMAVTPPILAASRDNRQDLRRYVLLISEALALIVFPLLVGLACVARLAVPLLFGERWNAAVGPLLVLALYSMVQSVTTIHSQILLVTGQASVNTKAALITLSYLPLAFWVGAHWGGTMGLALVWLLSLPAVIALPLKKSLETIEMPFIQFVSVFARPALYSLVMALVVLGVGVLLRGRTASSVVLAGQVASGALTYLVLAVVFYRERLRTLMAAIRGRAGLSPDNEPT
jgi:teichuronic acid exporter